MNPRERFICALQGKIPDEVPMALSITDDNLLDWYGDSSWETRLSVYRRLGATMEYGVSHHDMNNAFVSHMDKGFSEHKETTVVREGGKNIEVNTRTIVTPKGTLRCVEKRVQLEDVFGQLAEPMIKTLADYEIYLCYLENWLKHVEMRPEVFERANRMEAAIGGAGVRTVSTTLTFYRLFWLLRKVDDLLMDFYDDPALMRDVLHEMAKINQLALRCFNESTAVSFGVNCSGASASVIGPEFFREWVLPELRWLAQNKHPDKFLAYHTTGKIRSVVPLFVEGGADMVLRFESEAFGGDCSIADAKAIIGSRPVCVYGGFDPNLFLTHNREVILAEAKRCLAEGMPGGRFILAHTDAVPVGTTLADIQLATDYVHEHGRY